VEAQGKAAAAPLNGPFVDSWRSMVQKIDCATDEAVIALVGKYTNQQDSYLSVVSALKHACIGTDQRLRLVMVESSSLEESMKISDPAMYEDAWEKLRSAHGILVPGGFGVRGIEGKVDAIRHARENNVPFLGVCLGMQAAVIEYTRSMLGRPAANSREFLPAIDDADAAIVFMPEGSKDTMGGTMRLGARRTLLQAGSRAAQLYGGADGVDERHRHRYEVNPGLVQALEAKGLLFSGKDETQQRMEVVELPASAHPYFVAVQFHPEFKSRPQRPAPVFLGLLQAVKDLREGKLPPHAAVAAASAAVGTGSSSSASKSSKV
jgi:CTP synthase